VRTFRFAITVGFALALLFVGLVMVFPIYVDVCEKAAESTHFNCAPQNIGLIALRKLREPLSDGIFLAALISAIAAAVTARLTFSIRDIYRSQLAHGRQVERAYVNGGWGRCIDGRLYANINNDGKTPANVHHMVLAILPLVGLPHTPPALPRSFVNYNLEPYKRDFFSDHVFVEWDGLHEPPRVVYGRFWYRDIFGDEHESGFLLHVQPRAPAVAGFPEYWRWT
jgi:hypothetical protein